VIVLGFDTATQVSAVGLRLSDGGTLHASDDPAPGAHPGHATRLLTMARELLAQADVRWGELERIAVGVGPGRFTGLRVGIATARGLAQSLGVQLVGVSSLRALGLAAAHEAREAGQTPATGTIAVIDARRGESFIAAYSAAADFTALAEALPNADLQACGEIVFPSALRPAELSAVVTQIEQRGGPSAQRWRAVGDGALLYADALRDGGIEPVAPGSSLHLIDGAAICELGAAACVALDGKPAAVLPDYRRSPDAALSRPAASNQAASVPGAPAPPMPTPGAVGGVRR
jgi:tRNA threonylcarbamoyladenosine biosynthesis protein TsaB